MYKCTTNKGIFSDELSFYVVNTTMTAWYDDVTVLTGYHPFVLMVGLFKKRPDMYFF